MLDIIKRNRVLFSACAVLTLLVALLTMRWSNPGYARWIDELLHGAAYPFQLAFTRTTSAVSGTVEHYLYLVNDKTDNERLKLQVQALQEEVNKYVNASIEYNQLRQQLNFVEETPERKVFAEVIGASADNFHNVLLINKGRNAGIRRNFPVVLRQGVVGRVDSTTANESIVELLEDRRQRLPVIIQRTRDRAVLQGQSGKLELEAPNRAEAFGEGDRLSVERIPMLADVQVGDKVITSGLAGLFPKGMTVGTITAISRERHELFQSAQVEPAVDFSRLEGVFVIIRDRKPGDYPLFSDP